MNPYTDTKNAGKKKNVYIHGHLALNSL